jgi:type II secretory pathway pseudopilin PulG
MYLAGQAKRDSLEPLRGAKRPSNSGGGGVPAAIGECLAPRASENGYAMVALLIGMSVMAIMMSIAMPVWKTSAQREKEAELIFRGQQYVRAIELYQRKLPGAAPPNLDVLLDQKFLRKKYKDPVTADDFQILGPNSPGVAGAPLAPGQQNQRGGGPAASQPSTLQRGADQMRNAAEQMRNTAQGARGAPQGSTFGVQAGVVGVVSKSKASSLRLYNGRSHYNEWQFVYVARAPAPGAGGGPGGAIPGQPGRGGPGIDPGRGGRGFPGRGDGRGFPPGFGDGRGFPGRGDGRGFPPDGRGFPPNGRGFGPNQPGQQPGGPFGPGGFNPGQPFPQQPQQQRPPGN